MKFFLGKSRKGKQKIFYSWPVYIYLLYFYYCMLHVCVFYYICNELQQNLGRETLH